MNLDSYRPRPKLIRYLSGYLAMLIGSSASRITVTGRNFIPSAGPFIVAINHFSALDPFFVIYGLLRPVNFLMASDQEVGGDMGWAPWIYGFIPTNRSKLAPSTIKHSLRVLKKGEILGIFPEGTSMSTVLRPAKDGAAYLSLSTNVPILPVAVHGTDNLWSNLPRGIRQSVSVNIGAPFGPFSLTAEQRADKRQALENIGDEIMCRVGALLPEKHQGCVRDSHRVAKYQLENYRLSGRRPFFVAR